MRAMNLKNVWSLLIATFLGLAAGAIPAVADDGAIVLETPRFRYEIGTNGVNRSFVDRATGINHLKPGGAGPCAIVWKAGADYSATSVIHRDGRLHIRFGKLNTELVVGTEVHPKHILFKLESVGGEQPDRIAFVNVDLDLEGRPQEAFAACALGLNLATRVDALPALQKNLQAMAESRFGLAGARVAMVAAPMKDLLPDLQDVLATSSELPLCKAAGPWAPTDPFSRGSYLFNFGSLSLTNLEEWITTVKSLGFTQIDNHGGGDFFRFGDFKLNEKLWPRGWETWEKEILPRLEKAGIGSIFHTYAFFIDKRSKYVTPVPDPRLDSFRTFTLAKPLAADATEMVVNESTAEMKLITGFFEQNSVTLQIGEELVTFGGFSKEAPWTFSKLTRGALGTHAAAHGSGDKARHLKEMFGLFVPDVDTTLFEEVAANHADVVNQCGFKGIYLDAIDGAGILRGSDQAWHWGATFVAAIQKRLKRPTGMEMSAMWHHLWQYRTRWQAWDYPVRGHVRFIDMHAESINGGLLLPMHLGWWSFNAFDPPQVEPTYPEVMETLGARLVGWDAGISLTASVGREALARTPLFRRSVDILRTCEDLRHSGEYTEPSRARLREPGSEFMLMTNKAGRVRFRSMQSQSHTVAPAEPVTLEWQVTNSLPAQPMKLRIEALMGVSDASTSAVVIADFAGAGDRDWKRSSAAGVSFTNVTEGATSVLIATNSGQVPRNGAWARLQKLLENPIDLSHNQGLSVEVEGDGSGAILAIRLESPEHIAFGAVADRYVVLDFTGRRTVTLVETESRRWSDYSWGDGKGPYNVYRETIKFETVNSVSVFLQNLSGKRETRVGIGPIRAVPLKSNALVNPVITIGGKPLSLTATVPAGGWIECNGPEDCVIYGRKGEPLGKATAEGAWPQLPQGTVDVRFGCGTEGEMPRGRIVVFALGQEI